jgi:hypothetical protein
VRELKKLSDQDGNSALSLTFQVGLGKRVDISEALFNHASKSGEIIEDAMGIMSMAGF